MRLPAGALKIVDLQLCPLISDIMSFAACRHLEHLRVDLGNEMLVAQKLVLSGSCPQLDLSS